MNAEDVERKAQWTRLALELGQEDDFRALLDAERRDALATREGARMTDGKQRSVIIAGGAEREGLPAQLDALDVEWTVVENAADSEFTITATPDEWVKINRWLTALGEDRP